MYQIKVRFFEQAQIQTDSYKGLNYVNDQFFELTGHSRRPLDQFKWAGLVADEDLKKVEDDWSQMLEGKKSDGVQFRLKKTWVNQDGLVSNIWVQSSNHPELDENGKVISKPPISSGRRG